MGLALFELRFRDFQKIRGNLRVKSARWNSFFYFKYSLSHQKQSFSKILPFICRFVETYFEKHVFEFLNFKIVSFRIPAQNELSSISGWKTKFFNDVRKPGTNSRTFSGRIFPPTFVHFRWCSANRLPKRAEKYQHLSIEQIRNRWELFLNNKFFTLEIFCVIKHLNIYWNILSFVKHTWNLLTWYAIIKKIYWGFSINFMQQIASDPKIFAFLTTNFRGCPTSRATMRWRCFGRTTPMTSKPSSR